MKPRRFAPIPAACLCLALLAGEAAPARGQAAPPSPQDEFPSGLEGTAETWRGNPNALKPQSEAYKAQLSLWKGHPLASYLSMFNDWVPDGSSSICSPSGGVCANVSSEEFEKYQTRRDQRETASGDAYCPGDPVRCPGGGAPSRPAPAPQTPPSIPGAPGSGAQSQPPRTRPQVEAEVDAANDQGSGSPVGAGGYAAGDPGPVGGGGASGPGRAGASPQILNQSQRKQVVETFMQNQGKPPDLRSLKEKNAEANTIAETGPQLQHTLDHSARNFATDGTAGPSAGFDASRIRAAAGSLQWAGTPFYGIPNLDGDEIPSVGLSHHL